MNTKYQTFISSTFVDLIEERRSVMESILQLDCIPAGMELFPATNDDQFSFIKSIIDDCDYYIIILGGRYGSIGATGVGYTEMEFDYANKKGIPILAFVHENPSSIAVSKSDIDPKIILKLNEFREKVKCGRIVKFWLGKDDLASKVILGLTHVIRSHPRPGWNRGGNRSNLELLEELDKVRTENVDLLRKVVENEARSQDSVSSQPQNISSGTSIIAVHGSYLNAVNNGTGYLKSHYDRKWKGEVSWNEILYNVQPILLDWKNDVVVKHHLAVIFCEKFSVVDRGEKSKFQINDDIFYTIRAQLMALKWVDVKSLTTTDKSFALFWKTTSIGFDLGMKLRVLKD